MLINLVTIVSWNFDESDIINEFKTKNIDIPESMLIDFRNRVDKLKTERNLNYLNERKINF